MHLKFVLFRLELFFLVLKEATKIFSPFFFYFCIHATYKPLSLPSNAACSTLIYLLFRLINQVPKNCLHKLRFVFLEAILEPACNFWFKRNVHKNIFLPALTSLNVSNDILFKNTLWCIIFVSYNCCNLLQ